MRALCGVCHGVPDDTEADRNVIRLCVRRVQAQRIDGWGRRMIRVFTCTSTACQKHHKHCEQCSHAYFSGVSRKDNNGKTWRWNYNPRCGVLFLNYNFKALKRQPDLNSTAWEAFRVWRKELIEVKDGE